MYTFTLGEVVGSRGQRLTRKLTGVSGNGVVSVQAEEQTDMNAVVRFWFAGKNLDKKDFFGSSGTSVFANVCVSCLTLLYRRPVPVCVPHDRGLGTRSRFPNRRDQEQRQSRFVS
jgi:hypothetical protein